MTLDRGRFSRRWPPLAGAISAVAAALAVPVLADYEPTAPYVPTVEEDVELMLDVAEVCPDDYVIDLGSGDGRIAIAAARRGARALGIEIEPDLVELSRRNARDAGVEDLAAFVEGDLFEADISAASVVTLYLFPEVNIALRPKLLAELTPGTRVVSNSFDMGDWVPDVHDKSARSSGGILMWIVPARVAGDWRLEIDGAESYVLSIDQRYQQIEVRLGAPDGEPREGSAPPVSEPGSARLHADRIVFRAATADRTYAFSGTVDGDVMRGEVRVRDADGERRLRWRAVSTSRRAANRAN